jgi:hypothetical protein
LDLYISSSSSIEQEEVADFLISSELSSKPERVLDRGHFQADPGYRKLGVPTNHVHSAQTLYTSIWGHFKPSVEPQSDLHSQRLG